MARALTILILLLALSLPVQAGQPTIVTSVHPLALVVKELVGEAADVDVLIPSNVSPHNYSMKPSGRRRLEEADRFIWLGPSLEPFLANTMNGRQLADKSLALKDADGEAQSQSSPEHGSHDHAEGNDPHIWLDPDQVRAMLPRLISTLSELDSLERSTLESNREAFLERLERTESSIRERLKSLPKREIFTYHAAFGLFADHFDLTIAGTLTDNPERNPGARHLEGLRQTLNNAEIPCVMTEPQFGRDWWQGLNVSKPLGISHWDPLGSEVDIKHGGYTRFLEELAGAVESCRP